LYFQFIERCQTKKNSSTELHLHHILPKHLFDLSDPEEQLYCESEENKVLLSIEDHITAHMLLYTIYRHPQDKGAVLLLNGQMSGARKVWRKLGAEATHCLLKLQGRNFWNSEFQKEMAVRSMARPDALLTRSAGGKIGGRTRNLNRVITASDRYLFYYKNQPVFCVFNCQTGGDVVRILQSYPEKEKYPGRVSGLLNGSRRSLYGWSCEKI
jgi:hypothetical protein